MFGIVVHFLAMIISMRAKSEPDSRVVVAVFDAGFEGIDKLSSDRVLRSEAPLGAPKTDVICSRDRQYNGTGAYEKTWGWNYLGCGAHRTSIFFNNKHHGFRMARQILAGTSNAAVLPITSVVDAAGQHILFRPPDSFQEPMEMASQKGASVVNMSFALSPPYESQLLDSDVFNRTSASAYYRHYPKFEATRDAMLQMVKEHAETVFVVAVGNATRQYENGRWIYRRNNLGRRLPQALKLNDNERLPNLFVVGLCDEDGTPAERVNFSEGVVDVCVYRPAPYTVKLEETHIDIRHPWSSDAAAMFSNVVARIFENRRISPETLRDELDTYPGITRDPQGRYDLLINHEAFSVE